MTAHHRLDDDTRSQAALYAVGALTPAEVAAYEDHLQGCQTCRREVEELRLAADELLLVAPEIKPSRELRRKILDGVAGEGYFLLRRGEGSWKPTGIAGVDVRVLYADRQTERQTILLRMAPKSIFPVHDHHAFEECLVLEGDVSDGHATMNAGDYIRYAAHTAHGPLTTVGGNLLLITSDLHDEAA